jgi:opacity protein-like surface antigen
MRGGIRRRAPILAVLAASLAPQAMALAGPPEPRLRGFEVTPFLGHRFGGSFDDTATGAGVEIDDSTSYGFILGWALDDESAIEVLYSHQSSRLQSSGLFSAAPLFDLDLDTVEVGGLYQWEVRTVRPFIAGGVGFTRLSPDAPALDSETRFTFGMGGGLRVFPTPHVGFRFEGRGNLTFFTDKSTIFCSSTNGSTTCDIQATGSVLWQAEFTAGVVLRF